MALPLIPLLLVAGVGALFVSRRSGATQLPGGALPGLRNWTGLVGTHALAVYRNGPNWAWTVAEVGSGSQPTAIGALREALTRAFELAIVGGGDGWSVDSSDGRVHAGVANVNAVVDPWPWFVSSGEDVDNGGASLRGLATIAALEVLEPYTNGGA